jgi:AhpD family alkylhydroperoxidase
MRFDPYAHGGQYYEDVLTLAGHLARGPLEPALCQLVQVRVAQITGCSFCLRLHSEGARRAGVRQTKLDVLAGWTESTDFDSRERAALGLAEAMTRVGDGRHVDDATWSAVGAQFDDAELAALLYLIALINVWTRINLAVELPSDHELPRRQGTGTEPDRGPASRPS